MAKSSAERNAKYRKQLLGEEREKYKQRKAEQMRKSRQLKKKKIAKETEQIRHAIESTQRTSWRIRQQRSRANRKSKKKSPKRLEIAYSSTSSLGKAISRVKQRLPRSPSKQRAIVHHLASSMGVNLLPSSSPSKRETSSANKVSQETVDKVVAFYNSDGVSRAAPGVRDVRTVRVGDGKERRQVRHMTLYLHEAHSLFLSENPECKVGKSKFADIRPKHVLLSKDIPTYSCLCNRVGWGNSGRFLSFSYFLSTYTLNYRLQCGFSLH